jgi:hypothetical protein
MFLLAASVKRIAAILEIGGLFGIAVSVDLGLEIPDDAQRAYARIVKEIDWTEMWKALGLLDK